MSTICPSVQPAQKNGGSPPASGPIAQLTDPTSAQSIGASGAQTLVPVIQLGQGEGLIQGAGGLQQHV